MATLVQFLAAGVNGAESGTATFVLRGTSSSAQSVMYSDFEGTTQPDSNVVQLDANGAAEMYVDAYVDVQIRSNVGSLMRTVTVGNSAPLVEVQSTSFTGTDYDNSPANTAGEPITLKALLDKWITSAGAVDWKVLFGGSATNIQTAFAGISGMFFNVKDPTYGAVGNGVTDDTTAIMAAFAALNSAGGGILFFPPGTYQVSNLDPGVVDVHMMGCGEEASIIRSNATASNLLKFTDNTVASSKRITGLGFVVTAGHDAIIDVEENQQLTIDNCKFDGSNVSDACIRRLDVDGESNVIISSCKFVDIEGSSAIQNLSDDGESFITVNSCLFVVDSSFTGAIVEGPDFSVAQCKFDASAVTSGVYYHVDAESKENTGKYLGSFVGNKFLDGGSEGFVFYLEGLTDGSVFQESANEFSGFVDPVDLDDPGHVYENSANNAALSSTLVHLGSRAGRVLFYDIDELTGVPIQTLRPLLVAETIVITLNDGYTSDFSGDAFVFTPPASRLPPGSMNKVVVFNESGATQSVRFVTGVPNGTVIESVLDDDHCNFISEVVLRAAGAETNSVYGSTNVT